MQYQFLIYISYQYAIPIGEPLENEITKRGYMVKWFCDRESSRNEIGTRVNFLNSIQEVVAYDPHIVLAITDKAPDFLKALKVQVFHGFNADKRSFVKGHFRIRGFFDLYCTQGPSTTSIFKQQQEKHQNFEYIETGWSKVDPLFPMLQNKRNNPPVVFIASTFTKRLSLAFNDSVFEKIKSLTKSSAYKFMMVLHPKIPKEIVEKWKSLQNENFTFYDTTHLIPLFRQADIMFSDTTSAIQEFMLQKKPTVTFNHNVPKPHLIDIQDAKEIETAFEKALSYPSDIISKIQQYNAELHPYTDGKSSIRVIDACIDFLHKDKSCLKSKPINLMRKYKLRKQLNYFPLVSYNKALTLKKT